MPFLIAATLFVLTAQTTIASESDGGEPTNSELYDSFLYCSAYHLAKTNLEQLEGDAADREEVEGKAFLTAAALLEVAATDDELGDQLQERALAMIDDYQNGGDQAKSEYAGLGENCIELRPIAQNIIDEAQAGELTNAI
ncbi:hypothetical protein ACFOWX_00230 [Sphingorhabdus arenilitoris]|uniref:Uncharacterized protein n=1 Tax=Sphingorhabdus arenilitoris TaxID=1490041 RepID=A0ABV8RD39_9SPHN